MSEDWDESPAPNMGGVKETVEEEADNELLRQVGVWRVCTCACVWTSVCVRITLYTHNTHTDTDTHTHTHTYVRRQQPKAAR